MFTRKALVVLTIAIAAGCSQDQGTSGMSRSDLDKMNAEKNKFETQNNPINANTRFAAGQLAESRGEFPVAIEQFNAALKIDPANAPSLFHLGLIYTSQQQYSEAINTWKQYIKVTNGSAGGLSNLGFCYELANQPADAEAAYKSGIAREPLNQPCRVNYGLMLARQGRIAEATAQLQSVLPPAEVHYNLASVLESKGQKIAAKAEYQKALEMDPDMGDAKSRLAALGE